MQDFFHQQKEGLRPTRGHSSQTLKQLVRKTLFFFGSPRCFAKRWWKPMVVVLLKAGAQLNALFFAIDAIALFRYLAENMTYDTWELRFQPPLPWMIFWWMNTYFVDVNGNKNMDVSENSGTPKSSILIGFSIINHPFWGTPIFGNTHILI